MVGALIFIGVVVIIKLIGGTELQVIETCIVWAVLTLIEIEAKI